jgi:hypothetical protein
MKSIQKGGLVVGATENGNDAVLVSLDAGGHCVDRRCVTLTTGLSTHPYHHEGAWAIGRYRDSPWARDISLEDAIALIRQVHVAALAGARNALADLAKSVPAPIVAIAIRACPALPDTIEERIANNRAQVVADSVMYRQSLAEAARERGWTVHWYERDDVFERAAKALGCSVPQLQSRLDAMRTVVGPPWQAPHKLAAAAALAAR